MIADFYCAFARHSGVRNNPPSLAAIDDKSFDIARDGGRRWQGGNGNRNIIYFKERDASMAKKKVTLPWKTP